MNKTLILFIMIICIVCGCQTVTSTHNIPQDNVQHDSLVYPIENSTPAPMPDPMPAPMPDPMPAPMPDPMPAPMPDPMPAPISTSEAKDVIVWEPIVIDMTDEKPAPTPAPKVEESTPAPVPVPPVKVQTPSVVQKDKLWHIRTVSYADTTYNNVLAKKTKKLLEDNGISDVVIKKASNSKKTKSYIVVDAGSFESKSDDEAKEMQKKLHNLEDKKKKPFKDAFFVKYQ